MNYQGIDANPASVSLRKILMPIIGAGSMLCVVLNILTPDAYADGGIPLWTNRYNGPGNSTDVGKSVAVDSNGASSRAAA